MIMNLGKSAASFSESDSDRFFKSLILFEYAVSDVYFSLVLCSTTESNVCYEFSQGKPIRLGWDGDTLPVYSNWE